MGHMSDQLSAGVLLDVAPEMATILAGRWLQPCSLTVLASLIRESCVWDFKVESESRGLLEEKVDAKASAVGGLSMGAGRVSKEAARSQVLDHIRVANL